MAAGMRLPASLKLRRTCRRDTRPIRLRRTFGRTATAERRLRRLHRLKTCATKNGNAWRGSVTPPYRILAQLHRLPDEVHSFGGLVSGAAGAIL